MNLHRSIRGQGRVAGTAIGLRDEMLRVVIPVQKKILFSMYRQVLKPTIPPFQWVPAFLPGSEVCHPRCV